MPRLSQHAFVTPPELRGITRRYPVVIVGAGPVGLALAACLARFDIETVVLEKGTSAGAGSRAICLSRRSLEILDWLGAASDFTAKGLGWMRGRSYFRDRQIHDLCMPHSEDEKFLPMTNLQQYYMEEFLAQHCGRQRSIDIRWGTTLVDVTHELDQAAAVVATQQGTYRLACDYLIATDGARSQVRKLLGLSFQGSSFAGRYLITDVRLSSDFPTERRAWFDPPSNPGSTVLMHKQPDDIWRIDYQLLEEQDEATELQPQVVRSRVQRHLDFIGESRDWDLVWTSTYRAHALAIDSYVHGRVLLAGDAAHLVPIFGVRGLNSGFADAHNLAWKLACVLRGEADAALLETYSLERRAATLEILRQTDKTTRFVTPATRGDAIMRDAALELAVEHEFARSLVDPRQSVPFAYGDSRLNSQPRTGDTEPFAGGLPPGAPLFNMRVTHGSRSCHLLDWIGTGFTALFFVRGPLTAQDRNLLTELLQQRAVRWLIVSNIKQELSALDRKATLLEDSADAAARLYDVRSGTLYLVRPDGHVCARWRRANVSELGEALNRARCA